MPRRKLTQELVARVDRLRRPPPHEAQEVMSSADRADPETDERLRRMEARLAHLEASLEGLQDSVYRETTRLEEGTAELRNKLEPHNLAQAIDADARRRGV